MDTELQNGKRMKVYISYKHEIDDSAIRSIVAGLTNNGIEYSIDKNDLLYRGSISEYEREIGDSQRVIMVITQGYLESIHCMYEMANIVENGKLSSRVYPLVKIQERDNNGLQKLKHFWETRRNEELSRINRPGLDACVIDDLKKIDMVLANLDRFWIYIKDTNTSDFDELVADDAKSLVQCIKKDFADSRVDDCKTNPLKANDDTAARFHVTQYGSKSVAIGVFNGDTLNIQ